MCFDLGKHAIYAASVEIHKVRQSYRELDWTRQARCSINQRASGDRGGNSERQPDTEPTALDRATPGRNPCTIGPACAPRSR